MSKIETRKQVVNAITTINGTGGLATAKAITCAAGLHVATVRKHLKALRDDGAVTFQGDARCYVYAITEPTAEEKREMRAKRAARKAKLPAAKVRLAPPSKVPAQVATVENGRVVFAELVEPRGLHELGGATRLRRPALQAALVEVGVVTRTRDSGRWIYRRAS